MLLVLIALAIGGAAFLAAEAATYPARQRRAAVARVAHYGRPPGRPESTEDEDSRVALGRTLLLPFAKLAAPLVPPNKRKGMQKRLLSAGLSQSLTPEHVLGFKGLGLVSGALVGILAASATKPVVGILIGLVFGLISFALPDVLINGRIARRREQVQIALPDAVDLLAVSVEAGLGFDAAVGKLTETMEGPLIDEFALALKEMRIGESRAEGLRRMAARMDTPQLTSFIRAVIQADQLGSSLGAILRAQAADTRTRRQLLAEEKALKAPVKMIFPTAIFIFPAMFILILGPAMMNVAKGLSH